MITLGNSDSTADESNTTEDSNNQPVSISESSIYLGRVSIIEGKDVRKNFPDNKRIHYYDKETLLSTMELLHELIAEGLFDTAINETLEEYSHLEIDDFDVWGEKLTNLLLQKFKADHADWDWKAFSSLEIPTNMIFSKMADLLHDNKQGKNKDFMPWFYAQTKDCGIRLGWVPLIREGGLFSKLIPGVSEIATELSADMFDIESQAAHLFDRTYRSKFHSSEFQGKRLSLSVSCPAKNIMRMIAMTFGYNLITQLTSSNPVYLSTQGNDGRPNSTVELQAKFLEIHKNTEG